MPTSRHKANRTLPIVAASEAPHSSSTSSSAASSGEPRLFAFFDLLDWCACSLLLPLRPWPRSRSSSSMVEIRVNLLPPARPLFLLRSQLGIRSKQRARRGCEEATQWESRRPVPLPLRGGRATKAFQAPSARHARTDGGSADTVLEYYLYLQKGLSSFITDATDATDEKQRQHAPSLTARGVVVVFQDISQGRACLSFLSQN